MSNFRFSIVLAVLSAAVLSGVGRAAVIHVPGDVSGIQSAINASKAGDVILVAPGVYHENISFQGKAITLSSTNPADLNVVSNTIIQASVPGSVVTFAHGEGSNSVLAGFTVTGGSGSTNALYGTNTFWGAGVYCYEASPTIVGNIIVGNAGPNGDQNTYGYGGGIGCLESAAIITRNLIAGNSGFFGGGIMIQSESFRCTDNVICGNVAIEGGGAALMGGGQLINNTLAGNGAEFAGSLYASLYSSTPTSIDNNIICNATNGGGFYLDNQATNTQAAFNDVWNNTGGDYEGWQLLIGVNGNISQDPQFVDATNNGYHLLFTSPCINAGDPNFQPFPGETDFYGNPRVYANRVDIGASEYSDNYHPVAVAGPDQVDAVAALPALIQLDGSASYDPQGKPLTYAWSQIGGPPGDFSDSAAAKPTFTAPALGTYTFQLVVSNASFTGFADTVQVTLTNAPPIANAGVDQIYTNAAQVGTITLDGSGSYDPQNAPLSYQWTQLSGWHVALSDPEAVKPTVSSLWPGIYVFQLVVNNGLKQSRPATVAIEIGPHQAPVANAGPSLYVDTNSVTLDGTGSYEPDGAGTLNYQWSQVSGPTVTLTGANTATPLVSGFKQTNTVQKCVFDLVVGDGHSSSQPANVTITIVPDYGANELYLDNPPFDPNKPTFVAFGGGNCVTGGGMAFGGVWEQMANWVTVNSYSSLYTTYGDMLMVYLSSVARDYRQRIQVIGDSTGNMPAMDLSQYANATYKDARYAVNRVTLLDAVCQVMTYQAHLFNTNAVAGEQCWVDNYVSNDPAYSPAEALTDTLNVVCRPHQSHGYPMARYESSSLEYTNGGLTAFGYLSVIGDGKNYQLNTQSNMYYFVINSNQDIVFFNQPLYPGKILAPVQLTGPDDGATLGSQGAVLGCQPVENAVGYQLLLGLTPDRVMDYTILSDTTNAPQQTLTTLPQNNTWWTVRAYDQFGSTIYADPRLLELPATTPPVANAGPNQVLFAGPDGNATVTLDGSKSTGAAGATLGYTWAWAVGTNPYLSNGVSLTIELPVGVNTIQLMVNDGHVNSPPAEVKITVREYPAQPLLTLMLGSGTVTPSFNYLLLGTNYQLQVSTDLLTWSNTGPVFTATNASAAYPQPFNVRDRNRLFFRLASAP
jgi:hypothetical protein